MSSKFRGAFAAVTALAALAPAAPPAELPTTKSSTRRRARCKAVRANATTAVGTFIHNARLERQARKAVKKAKKRKRTKRASALSVQGARPVGLKLMRHAFHFDDGAGGPFTAQAFFVDADGNVRTA